MNLMMLYLIDGKESQKTGSMIAFDKAQTNKQKISKTVHVIE